MGIRAIQATNQITLLPTTRFYYTDDEEIARIFSFCYPVEMDFHSVEMDFHRLARPRNVSVDLKYDLCLCRLYLLELGEVRLELYNFDGAVCANPAQRVLLHSLNKIQHFHNCLSRVCVTV